ncbi:MAG TPA: hypothetical protein VLV88_12020 [Terriglobales bacterium]|nr:hypothetical protein [Terriglobales bacterium]
MTISAKTYIALVIAAGASVMFLAASKWSPASLLSFSAFLGVTLLASTLKIRIPGMNGTMSPNFAFLLIGMVSYSFSEVVVASFAAALLQCVWRPKQRLQLVQVLFSAAALPVSVAVSFWASQAIINYLSPNSSVALVILGGCFYLLLDTALVSIVVGLVEGHNLRQVWQNCYDSVFPFFLIGIVLTGLLAGSMTEVRAWQKSMFLLPVIVLSYLYFLGRHDRALQPEYGLQESTEEDLIALSSSRR